MTAPSVTVVVLAYNSWIKLPETLDALAAVTWPDLQILVVDNASTDGTVAALAARYPQVTVLASQENLGYAGGNNLGLRRAMEQRRDYALVLNDDVIVAPNFVAEMVAAAQAQPRAALLGPLVYHHGEPHQIQSAGGARTGDWQFLHRDQNQSDRGLYRNPEPVVWLTGCAILARCAALDEIGLFDPEFFMYWEDVDWCLRAHAAGWQVLFVPAARVWHKGVQADYSPNPSVVYYHIRNELLLFRKHHAGAYPTALAWFRDIRTLLSYSLRPRWQPYRQHRDARWHALRDYAGGRFGRAATV